ncbi:serine hydrolase [Aliikangiella sp. G2MR2-5]|uniref:serine hydrolase domain-containing protein n=1 Tax=Aliikangiella sp. G2MR2-5 TaxID=2788943 RepID=UPI0018AAF7F3|nr:serine hydrolase [Aliikangiella sp. G2MR2-5]
MKLLSGKKRFIAFLSIFFFLLGLGLYHREAYRLYKVVTLFDADQISYNFQHMSDIFPYRTIAKGKPNFKLVNSPLKLPLEFEFNNQKFNIQDYLEQTRTTGFIVLKDSQIVFEKYFSGHNKDRLHISWSVNKSIVSALIGIAISEGYIDNVNQPVTRYAPEFTESGYDGVSIENVLQMSSGVSFNEDYADFYSDINRMGRVIALGASINEFAATLKAHKPQGKFHHYVSMDTQVLGVVLKNAVGKSPSEYLHEKIWSKLGMRSDAKWLVDDTGMELAFGTLNVTLRDYARFGLLFQNRGNWLGEQIIPEDWFLRSTTPDKPHLMPGDNRYSSSKFGYGYQWWVPDSSKNDFMARGVYGQYIYVNPQQKIVIVKNSADPLWRSGSEENYKTTAMFQYIAQKLNSNFRQVLN